MKKIGIATITVAALLSLSHTRAGEITGDILYEDCIVASHWSGAVEKFVQAHPDLLHVNGITIIGEALREAFPCSKSN